MSLLDYAVVYVAAVVASAIAWNLWFKSRRLVKQLKVAQEYIEGKKATLEKKPCKGRHQFIGFERGYVIMDHLKATHDTIWRVSCASCGETVKLLELAQI